MFEIGKIQGEGSIVLNVSIELEHFLFGALKIIKNRTKLKKLWPLK
jgi:hypothetical protein